MKSAELTEKDLLEVEQFAYNYMSKEEIALIMELEDRASFDDEESKLYKSFWKGRLQRKAKFNGSVISLSDQLSSPAQAIEIKMAEKAAISDKKKFIR